MQCGACESAGGGSQQEGKPGEAGEAVCVPGAVPGQSPSL